MYSLKSVLLVGIYSSVPTECRAVGAESSEKQGTESDPKELMFCLLPLLKLLPQTMVLGVKRSGYEV